MLWVLLFLLIFVAIAVLVICRTLRGLEEDTKVLQESVNNLYCTVLQFNGAVVDREIREPKKVYIPVVE